MRSLGMVLGLLAAVVLLSLGLLLLPEPGTGTLPGLFSTLWVLVTLVAVLSFAVELWRRMRLGYLRRRHRGTGRHFAAVRRTGSPREPSRLTVVVERERRLD